MKYETPELTVLMSAIDAIRTATNKAHNSGDTSGKNEGSSAYEDWE